MEPKYLFFLFAALFIVTLGIAAIGILSAYNLNKIFKRPYLQTLLYQQIFFYSFLLYGAWGRILLTRILSGFEINDDIITRASLFIPALGLPFLIISWYMLIKFFYEARNLKMAKTATILYFIVFILLIMLGAWFTNTKAFISVKTPENFFLRLIIGLNLLTNFFILIPVFFLKQGSGKNYILRFPPNFITGYLIGVLLYSTGIWFIKEHFLVVCLTFLTLFTISALIPVFVTVLLKRLPVEENLGKMDFVSFCRKYEISKREAEIIQEICSGKSNQDIADSLFITLQTVKDHSHRIYTKTGVKNRVHLTNLVREKIKSK